MEWINLERIDQLEEILRSSSPCLLFKHSTRCYISAMALANFKKGWDVSSAKVPTYLLDLLSFRNLSDEIARRTGINHQSPQVIVFKDNKVLYTASHHGIEADEIKIKLGE